MKTQIIRIDSHDDAISVKDKMGWGQTPRILLVWPKRGGILNRRLDITYLKRHSITLGAQLAFVSKDPKVRYFAGTHHIPVFPNIRKAEESHWRPPRRRRRKKSEQQAYPPLKIDSTERQKDRDLQVLKEAAHPKPSPWLYHPVSRLFLFVTGVLSVLAIGFTLLPSAVIRIKPASQLHRITIPLVASIDTQQLDLTGKIPIRKLEIVVEGRDSILATGSIEIPDQKAQGKVDFRNLTDHLVTIPAGTVISTLGEYPVRFEVTRPMEIAPDSLLQDVPVEAIRAGVQGNVRSNSLLAIEGPLGLDLTVSNPTEITGGTNQVSPSPSQHDYDHLLEQMVTELRDTAQDELRNKLNSSDIVLEIDPEEVDILEIQYSPQEIRPSDQLQLKLRVAYLAYFVSGDDLLYLGQSVSDTNSPKHYGNIPSSLEIRPLDEPEKSINGRFHFDILITWQSRALIDTSETIAFAQWKTPEVAIRSLSEHLPVQETIQIEMNPAWWPRLPILPFRISVEIFPEQ